MTDQELREQFEKICERNNYHFVEVKQFDSIFKSYSLAQETIKAKDAEIESILSTIKNENRKYHNIYLNRILLKYNKLCMCNLVNEIYCPIHQSKGVVGK